MEGKCDKRRNSKRLHRAVRNVLNEYGLNQTKIEDMVKQEVEYYFKKHVHGMLASNDFSYRFERLITDVLNKEFNTQRPTSLVFLLQRLVNSWIAKELQKVVKITFEGKKENENENEKF